VVIIDTVVEIPWRHLTILSVITILILLCEIFITLVYDLNSLLINIFYESKVFIKQFLGTSGWFNRDNLSNFALYFGFIVHRKPYSRTIEVLSNCRLFHFIIKLLFYISSAKVNIHPSCLAKILAIQVLSTLLRLNIRNFFVISSADVNDFGARGIVSWRSFGWVQSSERERWGVRIVRMDGFMVDNLILVTISILNDWWLVFFHLYGLVHSLLLRYVVIVSTLRTIFFFWLILAINILFCRFF